MRVGFGGVAVCHVAPAQQGTAHRNEKKFRPKKKSYNSIETHVMCLRLITFIMCNFQFFFFGICHPLDYPNFALFPVLNILYISCVVHTLSQVTVIPDAESSAWPGDVVVV